MKPNKMRDEQVPLPVIQSIWAELEGTMQAPFPWKEMLHKIRLRIRERYKDNRDPYHFHC